MFDAHCHIPSPAQIREIPSDWRGLVCTSRQEEWTSLLMTVETSLGMTGAIGALPSGKGSPPLHMIERMERILDHAPSVQIGEVGLDRRFQDAAPIAAQREFLVDALELGYRRHRSVTLHIVGNERILFDILQAKRGRLPLMIWHGYTGSVETAKRFVATGGILSFGPSLWRPHLKLAARLAELRDMPFVWETDWPEGWLPEPWRQLPYEEMLSAHASRLAAAMDTNEERLEERIDAIGTLLTNQQTPR
ncbi:MAG: TatD family hydrolase [Sphaerochaetaceae bacterium]|jgi:TatD DNase family protein